MPSHMSCALAAIFLTVMTLMCLPAMGLSFDVYKGRQTCLLYTIDSLSEIPRIELKFFSNISSRSEHSAQLLIQTLDPHRNEVHVEKMVAGSRNLAKWRVARVMHRNDNTQLGWKGFTLAGDYTICFEAVPNPTNDLPEHTYVSLLLGDPRSQGLLEKHTLATKGESAAYNGAARIPHRRHHDEEEVVTTDDAEEYMEWIDEIETHVQEIHAGFNRLREGRVDFVVTSNTLFTRVWTFAVLTMVTMCGTMTFMYKGIAKSLKDKKLV